MAGFEYPISAGTHLKFKIISEGEYDKLKEENRALAERVASAEGKLGDLMGLSTYELAERLWSVRRDVKESAAKHAKATKHIASLQEEKADLLNAATFANESTRIAREDQMRVQEEKESLKKLV